MWPQTLQMSEEDCRSTLRRLELETYANVMGVFRAQGGLNDKKTKLLEELRSVFHISQDRHRAEARRVANDEHLSTIAKVVSGPNTWQEWSREGRRSYPMLPRVAPQTALGWIANNLASEATLENAKLPYPAETATAAMEEQAAILAANSAAETSGFRYPEKYVVTSDPFKMPDIPATGVKRNLKRGINDSQQSFGLSLSKKRNTNDMSSLSKHKNAGALTAAGASATSNSRKNININRLHQQRFFYQQQQKAKKLAKAVGKREKISGPNKSGRKSKKLKEQLNQQILQEEQFLQHDFSERSYENQFMQQLGNFDPSTNSTGIIGETAQQQQHIDGVIDQKETQSTSQQQKSFYLPLMIPQIASSKRDISRNLTKLQIPGQVATTSRIPGHLDAGPVSNQALNSPSVSSPIAMSSKTVADSKIAPLSTPVQKYIVEDRQPPASGAHHTSSVASAAAGQSTQQTTSTSQYVALSHLSTPNKLRSLNTTILQPGTKLSNSAKKFGGATILSATVLSPGGTSNTHISENITGNTNATTQLYSLVDGGGGNITTGTSSPNMPASSQQQILSAPPSAPTHAPPAVIQLHSNEAVRVGSQQSTVATSTQSKVLTTKILPIVLSGNTTGASLTKGDTAKNGSSTIVSSASFVTNSGTSGSTIIKSLPSMFVSGQHSGLTSSSPVFSTFGSTGPVYRKHPNILKSSSSALSRSSSASSGGPQIISNIRLTPAITTVATTNSNFTIHQTQSGIFQQPLRAGTGSSTPGLRSVKICQSPNGKVFIQTANVDASKLTKLPSGHIPQRILPNTLLGTSANLGGTNVTNSASGSLSSNQPGSPHRIAIQKVQIIPPPISGNALGNTTHTNQSLQQQQQQHQRLGTTPLTIGGSSIGVNKGSFSGNIFMSAGVGLRSTKSSGAVTLTKATFSNTISGTQNDSLSSSNVGSLIAKQHGDLLAKPSNVVVIDATSATNKIITQHTKLSALPSTSNIARSNLDSSRMITEDTPVDIIVDNSPNIAGEASPVTETSSITAVLASNVLDNAKQSVSGANTSTMMPITVLNATDWEMELDQATAANLTHNQQSGANVTSFNDSAIGQFKSKIQKPAHIEQTETAETIIIDDSFEDVIIEEEEHEEIITDNDEHYDEQGQKDMEIEVSNDSEIIMVDNLANIDERRHLVSAKSNDELEEAEDTANTKKLIMLNETVYKSISPHSIDHQIETSIDDNVREDLSSKGDKNDSNITEIIDLDHDSESAFVSDARSSTESLITQSKDLLHNNHEDNAQTIPSPEAEHHTNADHDMVESELMSNADTTTAITTTEVSKTTISASLFSVKEVHDAAESKDEVENEQAAAATTFDVSKEAHSSSKNDGVHATDQ